MTIKCSKCQHKNPDDTFYCGRCGARLQAHEDISLIHTKTLKVPTPSKTIAGKYKILAELGRGGMGVVYKAKDMRLDRTVALKFLAPEYTRDEEARKRFIQEAKAAAALEHANICTVYEVDEADGQTYISMSYIEGQSLKDKLKEGPLSIDDAKDIALQVATGLEKAHNKGIIHRDIKPANIMINDEEQAKITDFGLAKLSWGADLTKPAAIMGTVAYMSPEQARGDKVDLRTDIWSGGVVLYEMLTGQLPFKGEYDQAVVYSVLNEEPKLPSSIRKEIPGTLEKIVVKALEKDPDKRHQNMQDVIKQLKQPLSSVAVSGKKEKSIIVLPFEDISPGKDNEYFSDGLTEEIITDLSHIQDLLVISRNSAMTFKGRKKKTRDIAEEVNVRYVLEGSVRKAGNNLRITAQLIDAAKDAHIWADKYSGKLDDIFDIQEKVSKAIVDALKLQLSPSENKGISERPIEDISAYELYLRAQREIYRCTEDSLERALRDLQNSLEIVGENALIYSGIASVYFSYFDLGLKANEEMLQKAEEYASKVFDLKPDSPEMHCLLGRIERVRGTTTEAIGHFIRGWEINPNNWDCVALLSYSLALHIGKSSRAVDFLEKLKKIDPLSITYDISYLFIFLLEKKLEKSVEMLQRRHRLDPENRIIQFWYTLALAWNRQYDEANKIIEKIVKNKPDDFLGVLSQFFKSVLKKEKEVAMSVLTEKIKEACWNDPEQPGFMAGWFSLLDEKEEAFKWLERAIERGMINYPFFNEYDPFLENIRGEERFKKLMERVKHEWENFEL
jgi:serine/threonine protein kinase